MKTSKKTGSLPLLHEIDMSADRRVLIVDDDVDFADSLCDLLETEGYQVEVRYTARDAAAAVEEFIPHVALLDIRLHLERNNGLDLLATLKHKHPDLLCIVITAYADTDTAIKALQSDAYDYLRKPLYLQELTTTLNRCFEKLDLERRNRQAVAALCASEERYRSIFENALEGIFRSTVQEGLTDVNPALMQILGYDSKEELLALSPQDLYADSEELQHVMDQYRSKKAVRNLEVTWKKKNGECIVVSLTSQIILGTQGQVLFYEGMVQDITERKRAEEELANTKAMLETAFEQTPIPMAMVSVPDYIIRLANPACLEFLGVQDEPNYLGQSLFQFDQSWQDFDEHGNPRTINEMPLALAAQGVETRNVVYFVRRKDGTTRWESVSASPIRNGAGKIIAAYVIFPDITEHKQAEEALKEYSERLEEMVKERTQELQDALQKAQMADRLKSEFIANINHELRTPLTNLILYHQMLRASPVVKSDERLDVIGRELQRLRTLIEELLNLSRLDLGQVAFHPKHHNLNKSIRTLVNDRRALAEERGLTLTAELQSELPEIWLDEAMLVQAVSNLLTNALNYTPAGGQVGIRTRKMMAETGKAGIAIIVQDNGPGINEDDLPHLFERFYRGRAGRETGAPGTGLGLAIVKKIVERHNGFIEVKNVARGHGAVFTIWLPVEHEL